MMRRQQPQFPPPPEGIPERRQTRRREDDIETHEIVTRAVKQAPWVNRLMKTGKVASAVGSISLLVGGILGGGAAILGAMAFSSKTPKTEIARVDTRIDSNVQHLRELRRDVDSVFKVLGSVGHNVETVTILACAATPNPTSQALARCESIKNAKP